MIRNLLKLHYSCGDSAEPICRDDSWVGTCGLGTDRDGYQRCFFSEGGATSSCKLILNGLDSGGVLLYAHSLIIVDL